MKQIGKKCLYLLDGTHYKTLNVGTHLNEDEKFLQPSLARETTDSLRLQKKNYFPFQSYQICI